jgi:hypothetical protein
VGRPVAFTNTRGAPPGGGVVEPGEPAFIGREHALTVPCLAGEPT